MLRAGDTLRTRLVALDGKDSGDSCYFQQQGGKEEKTHRGRTAEET
jgi:hypothetical protein